MNTQFISYNEDTNDEYHYSMSYEIMPGEDFLSSIKKAKTMSVLKLVVSKEDIKDDFLMFAGRTEAEIDDEVEICLKRQKVRKDFLTILYKPILITLKIKQTERLKKLLLKEQILLVNLRLILS